MSLRTLDHVEVDGKTVLVRADLNVPIKDGRITDTTRIDRLVRTLNELIRRNARIVLMSHFGRPNGKRDPKLSLAPVLGSLSAALPNARVTFAPDCVGPATEAAVAALGAGDIVLLENLRFHAGEEANDPTFAKALARLGGVYVDDAFSCAHRAHASIDALARLMPAVAGRLMEEELTMLGRALASPKRPVAAIIGGAKISTKLALIENLVGRVNTLAIGGGMANTLLLAQGESIGKSLCEHDQIGAARAIVARARTSGCTILLPHDVVVARELKCGVAHRIVALGAVATDEMILDIGPNSVASVKRSLESCRTLIWNGPVGAFEYPPFDAATTALARIVADLTTLGTLLSVAGGGETVAAVNSAGVAERFSYLSTAGGAFLEWIEGRELPGVAVLEGL
ncbi:MAG: phosphoglycerate kinase [Alphaproteobacteria bacterium]|nr:phosphoglycerate kinase [Alphaproteobacteria bacterium]